jgi:ABC-type amino acid transport substrate-binding protein
MPALLMLAWAPVASANTTINVGAYYFPPIAEVSEDHQVSGLLGDLLHRIEDQNPGIEFHIVYTSPQRRHLDFEAGLYDVIFFESDTWGWSDRNVTTSPPLLTDEELYVALKKPGRDQSFFNNVADHRIVALSGYHYRFSGFETSTKALQDKFDIELSSSQKRNLQLIIADRPSVAEITIASRAYLHTYFSEHPKDRNKLLISEKPDHKFDLRIIARKDGPVSASDLYQMLAPMIKQGTYQSLVKKWGLTLPGGIPAHAPNTLEAKRSGQSPIGHPE